MLSDDPLAPVSGTFTVQFYDGVIRCLKRMHIKAMPEDAKGQVRVLSVPSCPEGCLLEW